jgi:tetratricopeptide (TPR) repeat protein
VKLMQRRATTAVALALGCAGAPSLAEAQPGRTRMNMPGADTPRLLVSVCSAGEKILGVQMADALRGRMSSTSNPRQLFIITKEQIVGFLESSGYKADSSLGLTDLKELAKGLRADEITGCDMTRNASGAHRIEPRLMWAVDPGYSQPLPVIETSNLVDAARQIEKTVLEARKQFPDFKACRNHISGAFIDKAIASARLGITKYPNATIARTCLVNAFRENKQLDSALKVIEEIRRIDSKNKVATQMAFLTYKDLADQEKDTVKQEGYREQSVRALVELLGTDPGNPTLTNTVVNELGKIGKPAIALPIIDTLLSRNPGDPLLLRQRWLMSLAAAAAVPREDTVARRAAFSNAITAGEDMIKSDQALADSGYYFRQVAAAIAVSPQKTIEYTSKSLQKFPNNHDNWWYKANAERNAGQVQAAQQSMARLLALNPKYPNASVMLGQLFIDQRMFDSAVVLARRSVAAGEPRETWGRFLVGPTNAQYQLAAAADQAATADSTNRERRLQATAEFEATLALAQESDKMAPTAQSKFFIGVASFQIGYAMVNRVQATQAAMTKAQGSKPPPKAAEIATMRASMCTDAKRAQDMFLLTMVNMPAGGSVEPRVAQQLLGATGQMSPFAEQAATTFCRAAPAATKAPTTPPPRGSRTR